MEWAAQRSGFWSTELMIFNDSFLEINFNLFDHRRVGRKTKGAFFSIKGGPFDLPTDEEELWYCYFEVGEFVDLKTIREFVFSKQSCPGFSDQTDLVFINFKLTCWSLESVENQAAPPGCFVQCFLIVITHPKHNGFSSSRVGIFFCLCESKNRKKMKQTNPVGLRDSKSLYC